jgi:adenosylcobinamide kinase/adenosylcobinamide-phosphate guanylyltransferase
VLIALLGGARSGKSALALQAASEHGGAVTYIATSPRIDGDDDLATRVATHRAERPSHWRTIEEQHDLLGALSSAGDGVVIVDCLTLWVSNLMWRGDDDADVVRLATRDAAVAAARQAPTIVVSNEVGLGVHPSSEAGRRYRDLLGRVNRTWCSAADRALLLVAGRAVELTDPRTLLR